MHDDRPPGEDRGPRQEWTEWFEVREANVSYDHPYDLPLEHALNIDFVNEALGPGARVAVELSVEAARQLVKTIEAVLAQADQRGVLEDLPLVASTPRDRSWRSGSPALGCPARAAGDPARRARYLLDTFESSWISRRLGYRGEP